MNLVCDVAGNQTYYPCTSTLLLNVPGFDSTIIKEETALCWTVSIPYCSKMLNRLMFM